ncbi:MULTISPECIES: hypothetical protein [Paraburkholderia]|uniref:Uncharacterized protein n=1 Tax=Paraburkholderia podalyriae TaxID=1938811 RepID=A0ABR7Q2V9_9BURK|nr:hypothetical protein [Paraburkholderia podalyriae]MBC8752838.1 hypothetical protein [Paraburkholderia podalyriae]
MAKAAHIVFARDKVANVVAASDFFAHNRPAFFCVACGKELRRNAPETGFPYFSHVDRTSCRLAAHYALRAAAQHVLMESRFIKVPIVGVAPATAGIQGLLVQWTDCIADIKVIHVPVDFVAETADGQLIIDISIPGLGRTAARERIAKLEVPALEVTLPDPTRVKGWADLRRCLLHSVDNKRWIYPFAKADTSASPLPAEQWHAPATTAGRAADARAPTSWTSPLAFADNAFFRQLRWADQLDVLQKQMGLPCGQWPSDVDIDVRGESAFGVDRRGWQADAFSHFVMRTATEPTAAEIAFSDVLKYLEERYWVEPNQEAAARKAVFYYLQALAGRGVLSPLIEDIEEPTYLVTHSGAAVADDELTWTAYAMLSASQLRVLSVQAGLRVPIDLVQELLESFDDCHPSVPVGLYVATLARKLHAPPGSVLAFLKDAGLVTDAPVSLPPSSQENLF